MRALVLSEYKRLEVRDVPLPVVGDADVLVRVRASGICGSDVHGYDGSTGRRLPPLVMGHEAAGVVEKVGTAVRGIARSMTTAVYRALFAGHRARACRISRQAARPAASVGSRDTAQESTSPAPNSATLLSAASPTILTPP